MKNNYFEIEPYTPFSESLIWQLNRDFYQEIGVEAWSKGTVPHQITSNSMVGKTYAELILGFLKDLAGKGQTKETVYILELGAGHGRLAFHILKHLQKLQALLDIELPPFCYILSDIVEDNLLFFKNHPQLQTYYEQGILDFAYFDAIGGKEIHLQYANKTIHAKDLSQPLIAIANYFFDSLPNDLFYIKDGEVSTCSVALDSKVDPKEMDTPTLISNLKLKYQKTILQKDFYPEPIFNEILEEYKTLVADTYLFFPKKGIQCLDNLNDFSDKGLMILSMDKGFHEIHDLNQQKEPEIITHGSLSFWVNYHALGAYCEKQGGKFMFPIFSTFHIEVGCLLFVKEPNSYQYTNAAYQRSVNDFGPDDFNSLKKMAYKNVGKLTVTDLIALLRSSNYDSTFFIKILPYLKKGTNNITTNQRNRVIQSLHQVWHFYFNINEPYDFAYEIGGFLYDLGSYTDALTYFQYSSNIYGKKDDIYYNRILCYYQLRQDALFSVTLKEAKENFPNNKMFEKLDALDLNAK